MHPSATTAKCAIPLNFLQRSQTGLCQFFAGGLAVGDEHRKHEGSLPIVGVNTYINPQGGMASDDESMELRRASAEEKASQIEALRDFQQQAGGQAEAALERLQEVALSGDNIFAELMNTVRFASLGQVTHALYQVGGRYRRSM